MLIVLLIAAANDRHTDDLKAKDIVVCLLVVFIALFWKPYFLFNKGLNKNVSMFWKCMAPYYTNFIIFTVLTFCIYNYIIQENVNNIIQLISYGLFIYPTILTFYFLSLFYTTKGMKYFTARYNKIYNYLKP